jgi:hypothetical protein
MYGDNWTFWLIIENFAIGIITLLAVLVVLGAAGWELLDRKVHKAPKVSRITWHEG